jgi:sialic acid synthase SpsE
LDQNNLLKLKELKNRYPDFDLGFMDHSDGGGEDGLLLGLVVLGIGVSTIEKHITLDRELQIEDYVSGLTPSRFIEYTRIIHKFARALGSNDLVVTNLEEQYRVGAAKVVVAAKQLRAGRQIERSDVAWI